MKNFHFCLFSFLILTISGCSKSSDILIENNDETTNLSNLILKSGWTMDAPLMPTGNSTLDTKNLQDALHDTRFDTGGTLYLGPGTFLVHASLVRQSLDPTGYGYNPVPYNGTIQGAGKGVTIIKSVRGPGDEAFTPFYENIFDITYPSTFIIGAEDYLGFKDMTFIADPDIADVWSTPSLPYPKTCLLAFITSGSGELFAGNDTGTDFINVHFVGSLNSNGQPDMPHLLEYLGAAGGIHNIKSCEFENGHETGMASFWWIDNATFNIGGSIGDKVILKNTRYEGILIGGRNSTVNMSYVETEQAPGGAFVAFRSNTLLTLNALHNDINPVSQSNWAGIEVWNYSINGNVNATISQNKIQSEDSFLCGPIFMEGAENVVITNNIITGRGAAAIYLGPYSSFTNRYGSATLMGNNLQNWENTGINPWGFTAAPIWLGSYYINSTVVGGNNKINVFDEPGYDQYWYPLPPDENGNAQTYDKEGNIVPKNNVFTGVNNLNYTIGKDVRDAMKQRKAAKQKILEIKSR